MRITTPLLALALMPALAAAQTPVLSQHGGNAFGPTTWHVEAAPIQAYGVILATSEVSSEILPGVFLDIDLTRLNLTFTLPGFFGLTSASGEADATVNFNHPALIGTTISSQCLTGPFFDDPSNLVRVTLGTSGTFSTTLGAPLSPLDGGTYISDTNNDVHFIGGNGIPVQRYDIDLEEFHSTVALAADAGLTAQSVVLDDGRVLITGGFDAAGFPTDVASIYDPVSGTTAFLTMGSKRVAHRATKLVDGRVWISGGIANISTDISTILASPFQGLNAFSNLVASTEYFDPATDTFSAGPDLPKPRALHSATLLADNTVLVAGGMASDTVFSIAQMSNTAVAFQPLLGAYLPPVSFTGARLLHSAMLQTDGSVLFAGGFELHGLLDFLSTGDFFKLTIGSIDDMMRFENDLSGGTFTSVGTLSESRGAASMAYTSNGDILIAGGMHIVLGPLLTAVIELSDSADLYTEGAGSVATGSMANKRYEPLMVALPDGTLMVVGGSFPLLGGVGYDAEVYQP